MKRLYSSLAAVALLAVGVAVLTMMSPEIAHAAGLAQHNPLDRFADWHGHFYGAEIGLVALRGKLSDLKTKAKAKLDAMVDGLSEDQVRALETEHAEILRQIETTEGEIAAAEEAERNAPTDPAPAPAPTGLTAAQAADIMRIGQRAGMDLDAIETAVRSNTSVDAFRTMAFEHLAEQSSAARTVPGRVVRDEAETRALGMETALAIGFGAAAPEGERMEMARGFMGHIDVVEFAADAIGHRGQIRTVREREEVLTRAFHTTSDFPAIFSSAINTALESRYATANQTYREISRRRDFMDFRPHYAVGIGEFPMLEKVTEAGEIKFGTFGESKETIAVVPYAKAIRITRQMLVNDRLGAIGAIMGGYGRTVSRFEEITFYSMMLAGTTKLSDGNVVFHASHNNLAGAGAAINVTTLGAGRAAMRKQTGLDDAKLNITPSILLVSPDKEDEALQYLAPITANDSVKVNPHVGKLTPVVAAELSGNAWYLFADPDEAAVYQWGLLDGYTAPRVRFDEPFGTQGIGMSVEHDFGVGAIDYRGGWKNPGN